MRFFLLAHVFAALILSVGSAWAQESAEEFTASITADLAEENSEAAQVFTQANEALDRLDLVEAEILYRRVMELAPQFFHAKRRLSSVVLMQGRREEAVLLTQEVLRQEQSPENRVARIDALLAEEEPRDADTDEAVRHAEELIASESLHWSMTTRVCDAAIAAESYFLLDRCVSRLEKSAPDEISTHLYGWTLGLAGGSQEHARAKLELAREAGLDEQTYKELLAVTKSARPPLQRLLSFSWRFAAVWLGGLVLLLGLGIILSRVTLRAAASIAKAPSGEPVGLSASLRSIYRGVLWLTCSFYYLSLPIVVLAVIGLGGAVILWMLSQELISLKLLMIVLGVVIVTVIAVLRSVLLRPPEMDPGEPLDLRNQPRLRGVLDEVAREIGTRAVDSVYLTPGTDLAVIERGGFFRQLRGMPERCLILGVGVLDGMRMGPFKSILGHEYGHFSNRDTAGGGFALAVTRSIHLTAMGLAEGGAAVWYNPAWLFLIGFNWVFLIVSQGASRLQEILADRWAVLAYGAKQFERGLRHVIHRSVCFEARVNATLEVMLETEVVTVSPNFYRTAPAKAIPESDIEQAIEVALNTEASLADSHPSPAQRFEYVRSQSEAPTGDLSDCEEEVWRLFPDREEVERAMSRLIWVSSGMVSDEDLESAYA